MYEVSQDWLDFGEELRTRFTLGQRQYQARLRAHYDCRDPDHPGCKVCEPELFGEDEDEDF